MFSIIKGAFLLVITAAMAIHLYDEAVDHGWIKN